MVESVALEMRSAGNGTEGSNPSLSSIFLHVRPQQAAPAHDRGSSRGRYLMVTSDGAASVATTAPTIRNNTI